MLSPYARVLLLLGVTAAGVVALPSSFADNVGSLKPGFRPHPEGEPAPLSPFYTVALKKFVNPDADPTNQHITVFYPTDYDPSTTPLFRFIPYMHGFGGGGVQTAPAYYEMCHALAGFGYVVALPHACDAGCVSDGSLGFDHYFYEQLKTIDWAKSMPTSEAAFSNLNLQDGIAIAGHSMGGQATLFTSAYNASAYDVRVAAYHHAWTEDFPAPTVPFLSFTSDDDDEATATEMGLRIFETPGVEHLTRGVINKGGYGHHEPDILGINPLLAQFTVAWFKLILEGVTHENGVDYEDMIFGSSNKSICTGGNGAVNVDMCKIVDMRQ